MSNDAVLRKEVPFYCYKIKILFFTYLYEKFEKNYNGAYGGNFKILQSVITSLVCKIESNFWF